MKEAFATIGVSLNADFASLRSTARERKSACGSRT